MSNLKPMSKKWFIVWATYFGGVFLAIEITAWYWMATYTLIFLWEMLLFLSIELFTAMRKGHKGDTWSESQWRILTSVKLSRYQWARVPFTVCNTSALVIRGCSLPFIFFTDPVSNFWVFGPVVTVFIGLGLSLIFHIALRGKAG